MILLQVVVCQTCLLLFKGVGIKIVLALNGSLIKHDKVTQVQKKSS